MNTRIKLYRKIDERGWRGDPNTFSLFMYLLTNTNIKDKEYMGYTIKKGQCVIGRKSLSKKLGMSEQNIRTSMNRLKSTNEITSKSTNRFSIITVLKWELYQPDKKNQPANQPAIQPATNQQLTTPKEYNNIITTKEKIVELVGYEKAKKNKAVFAMLWMLIELGYKIDATTESMDEWVNWIKQKGNIYGYKTPVGSIDYAEMLKKFDRWYEWHKEKNDDIKNYKSSVLKFLDPNKKIKGIKK